MDDRILMARRVHLAASDVLRHLHGRATLRVVCLDGLLPADAAGMGKMLTETVYRPEDRPMVEWCQRISDHYRRGLSLLASFDPDAEAGAMAHFDEVRRLLAKVPGPTHLGAIAVLP